MLWCPPQQDNLTVSNMGRAIGAGCAVLAALAVAGGAEAGALKCAKPQEVTAIQAAAVQQELMVAALTCHDVPNFNSFQTSFNSELRASDNTLLAMFHRLYGYRKGEVEYHAFKTRLANDSSMRAIHNSVEYCQEASNAFAAALTPDKPTLATFVEGVQVVDQSPFDSCEIRVASGLKGTGVPKIVPRPNPVRIAQADTATAAPAPLPPAAPAPAPDAMPAPAAPAAPQSAGAVPADAGVLPDPNAPADPNDKVPVPPTNADTASNQPQQQPEAKKDDGWLSSVTGWF